MKKMYQAPTLNALGLTLDESLLSNEVDGGSFQDAWIDVDSRFTDDF